LAESVARIEFALHPRQSEVLRSTATEILYGGAAGGGKSHVLRVLSILWAFAFPGLQIYLFRRISDDLVKNHVEGPTGYRALLAPWVESGGVEIVEGEIRFKFNGSRIFLCHVHDPRDRYKYQGAEIHVLLMDELTHFPEEVYRFLRSRVRLTGITLPPEVAGRFPRIVCASNPGNIGHAWVKRTWIDPVEPMRQWRAPDEEGGMLRQFIPARLADNPSLMATDPTYLQRLRGLGSEALVKAMESGDWNVVEGAYFSCWRTERHVVEPFEIPAHWTRFRSFDWGSAKPFSLGWWAVASEDTDAGYAVIPRGALVRYREYYGAAGPDVGLKLDAPEVARRILARQAKGESFAYSVADPAIFKVDGGPSIAETMAKATNGALVFRPADNSRVNGWAQLRARLEGDGDGRPMIYTFSTCLDSIRTIPALMHDEHKPEDVDTDSEDHCFAAGTLVQTPRGPVAIEALPEFGEVQTRRGPMRYRGARMTRGHARTVKLFFSDGGVVVCTPDHRFITESGWKRASELKGETIPLWSCRQPCRSSAASATTGAAGISSARVGAFIAWCGRALTGRFLPAGMCITPTGTAAITPSGTFASCPPAITCRTTNASAGQPRSGTPRGLPRRNGTARTPASAGTPSILSAIAARLSRLARSAAASIAEACSWARSASAPTASGAGRIARRVRCVGVVPMPGERPVYCLTVPDCGEFLLASGAAVSNCADDWRYGCMSRPWTRPAPRPVAREVTYTLPTLGEITKRHADKWRNRTTERI